MKATNTSSSKDSLIIKEGPMTRTNKVGQKNEGLLAQATIDETLINTSKSTSFMLGSEKDLKWINLIQATNEGGQPNNYAVT